MRLSPLVGSLAFGSLIAFATAASSTAGCAQTMAPSSTFDDDGGPLPHLSAGDGHACSKLECQRVDCGSAGKTRLAGVVVNGSKLKADPIYNAIVYIPNGKVEPFKVGASCDRCGTPASGEPIAVALTGPDGTFVLDDVPVGKDIPLVVQLGKWRRQVTVPAIDACTTNVVSRELTRMPRNQREGDIPQMAIATGLVDPLECVLRKMGIDDDEFTGRDGTGRVHMYYSNGVVLPDGTSAPADSLWSSAASLSRYDIVLLPCEGDEIQKSTQATQALIDYTAIGGRAMTSHFGYVWIAGAQQPFPSTADWFRTHDMQGGPATADIDRSSPKGQAMAEWLASLGASPHLGTIAIEESRRDVGQPRNGSTRWIYRSSADDLAESVLHLSFNTPVGKPAAEQCGRVVYSDFHVAAFSPTPGAAFPNECDAGEMTATERVLEFMLYDLATCVQDERQHPEPPPIR